MVPYHRLAWWVETSFQLSLELYHVQKMSSTDEMWDSLKSSRSKQWWMSLNTLAVGIVTIIIRIRIHLNFAWSINFWSFITPDLATDQGILTLSKALFHRFSQWPVPKKILKFYSWPIKYQKWWWNWLHWLVYGMVLFVLMDFFFRSNISNDSKATYTQILCQYEPPPTCMYYYRTINSVSTGRYFDSYWLCIWIWIWAPCIFTYVYTISIESGEINLISKINNQ